MAIIRTSTKFEGHKMRTIEKTIYKYSELSESAQEKARAWYREASAGDNYFAESVFEDAANLADILGIDLRQTRKTKMDGSHSYEPTIYYSGFSSQGDGACFVGSYKYKKGACKALRQYAPVDAELHRIADELQATQKRYFYALEAKCSHRGHYYHSGCMSVEAYDSRDEYRDCPADEITDSLRSFADWIYSRLESAYEFDNSDETIAGNIEANEYEFSEDGSIF